MKAKHMKEKKKRKFFANFILVLLIAIFIYSTYQVVIWLKSNYDLVKLEESFSEIAVDRQDTGLDVDFEKLQKINPDIIGWIRIKDTDINYPILQGPTDEYYLRLDINKKYNIAGSIFVDSSTKRDFSDENTVIYGHNLKSQKMFADLTRIYNGELGKDVNVEIYQKNKESNYKVISAYLGEQDINITRKNFSDSEKESFIDDAMNKSNQEFVLEKNKIDTTNKMLTLVTCDKTGAKRFVVNAIKTSN